MTNPALKVIAITFGGGLAFGMGMRLGQTKTAGRRDETENRYGSRLADLEEKMGQLHPQASQDSDLGDRVSRMQGKLEEIESLIASQPDSLLESRMQQLEDKLYRDLRESERRSMEDLVRTIEVRVVKRILTLENGLNERSEVIAELRQKFMKADRNIEMLLLVMGRITKRIGISELPPFGDPRSEAPSSTVTRAGAVWRKFSNRI